MCYDCCDLHCVNAAILGGEDQGGNSEGEDPASMLSVKEERDLHTLLDMFAMGVGDVDQFQTRLQDELAALEVDAVVYESCRLSSKSV